MGEPTDRVRLPDGGLRLEYARGPYGKHTYRIELGADGLVRSVRQILTDASFAAVVPGMSRDEVRERLGRPSETRVGWRGVGELWSYRYDISYVCRWLQVWLVDDLVREAGYAPDPVCDEDQQRRRD